MLINRRRGGYILKAICRMADMKLECSSVLRRLEGEFIWNSSSVGNRLSVVTTWCPGIAFLSIRIPKFIREFRYCCFVIRYPKTLKTEMKTES